jgi:hypothetical protein
MSTCRTEVTRPRNAVIGLDGHVGVVAMALDSDLAAYGGYYGEPTQVGVPNGEGLSIW